VRCFPGTPFLPHFFAQNPTFPHSTVWDELGQALDRIFFNDNKHLQTVWRKGGEKKSKEINGLQSDVKVLYSDLPLVQRESFAFVYEWVEE